MRSLLNRKAAQKAGEVESAAQQESERRESQRVRINQSRLSLRTVTVVGLVFIVALWNQVENIHLVLWIGSTILAALVRAIYCVRIERGLEQASHQQLLYNERWLYVTSLINTTIMGTGYWWICLDAPDGVVLTVTLLTSIYAVGTAVNSSMQSRYIPELLFSNLGQGIIFFAFVQTPPSYAVALALVGMIVTLIMMCRQITELFVNSLRIRDENREKNLQLQQQKKVIEEALQKAENANVDKNRFMAAASHDLRQPLHAISLFLGSLRLSIEEQHAFQLLDKIEEATAILNDQFNSMLDLSKFDAGVIEPNLSSVRLDRLINTVFNSMQPLAEEKGLSLVQHSVQVTISTDALLFERVLANLVVNAINFTDAGRVSVEARFNKEKFIEVSVSDTGQGIDVEEQERIFMDYYQVHNEARSKGKGTGLGLSIVRRIADLLENSLSLTSEVGVGSTFTVIIPQSQVLLVVDNSLMGGALPPSSSDSIVSPLGNRIEGSRLLVVDDDPSILEALSSLIQLQGGECFLATSSGEVESINAENMHYDMAILDDMLGGNATGLDIAKSLVGTLNPEKIVITTGNTSSNRLSEIRNCGFTVLTKPIAHEDFINIVNARLAI